MPKRMQKGMRVINLKGAIEKSPILLSKYWKCMIGWQHNNFVFWG